MNINPQQIKKANLEAMSLLTVFKEPEKYLAMCEEIDKRLALEEANIAEIKGLKGIVDTLAQAEEIRREANAHKLRVETECEELSDRTQQEAIDAEETADELTLNARNANNEAQRLQTQAKDTHDIREENILHREQRLSAKEQSLQDATQFLETKEEDFRKKVQKANSLFT